MSALGPHSLNAACRAIFVQAAEDHILPRILRDASDPESPRRYLEAMLEAVGARYDTVEDYLGAELGIAAAAVVALRDRLLE